MTIVQVKQKEDVRSCSHKQGQSQKLVQDGPNPHNPKAYIKLTGQSQGHGFDSWTKTTSEPNSTIPTTPFSVSLNVGEEPERKERTWLKKAKLGLERQMAQWN